MNKKPNLTPEEINSAIKFLNRYKHFFKLDDDDIQEILIKFNIGYDSNKGAISTFLKTTITNYMISKWRNTKLLKNAHTAIKIDDVKEDDNREWLMAKIASDDVNILEEKESLAEQIRIIGLALEVLTPKQRIIIEKIFFEQKTTYEISDEIGVTHQSISLAKFRALEKMNIFFKKNNIKMVF